MPGHENFTSLEALPPSVGDAQVAAVLLRDLAASMTDRHGGVRPAAVEVDDTGWFTLRPLTITGTPVDTEHAPVAAPELFDGADTDGRTDVYAAACLALTRYLGTSPLPAPALARRAPTTVRIGALRQAHRTLPARLGALPDPFRAVFAQAVAKQAHLRPTPARLVTLLDAAFAAAGEDVLTDARSRVRRLVLLARVFVPIGATAAVPLVKAPVEAPAAASGAPLHLPLRALPAFARPSGVARVALIAAVAVVATGGVAVAAVVGLGGGTPKTPQAVSSREAATPSASPSVEPVAATSSAAVSSSAPPATSIAPPATTAAPPVAADPGSGSGGSDNDGSGNGGSNNGGGSDNSGSGSGNGGSGNGGGSGSGSGSSTPAPPATQPPATQPPATQPPATQPPATQPPSSTPPTPPRGSPTGEPPAVDTTTPRGTPASEAPAETVPPASDAA